MTLPITVLFRSRFGLVSPTDVYWLCALFIYLTGPSPITLIWDVLGGSAGQFA